MHHREVRPMLSERLTMVFTVFLAVVLCVISFYNNIRANRLSRAQSVQVFGALVLAMGIFCIYLLFTPWPRQLKLAMYIASAVCVPTGVVIIAVSTRMDE
jgi:uncharacterized membrane protein HdeD (DUF308 family)